MCIRYNISVSTHYYTCSCSDCLFGSGFTAISKKRIWLSLSLVSKCWGYSNYWRKNLFIYLLSCQCVLAFWKLKQTWCLVLCIFICQRNWLILRRIWSYFFYIDIFIFICKVPVSCYWTCWNRSHTAQSSYWF